MAIEGPLKELNIHDVFQLLDLSQKTGVLRVRSELRQNAGTVYFEGGAVVGAEIQSNPHPLGKLLLRTGKLSEEDLTRARATQTSGDSRRLGEILVAIGAISPRELNRQVRQQIEEVVFELMGWAEGYFAFEEGSTQAWQPEAAIRIPTGHLLMEAARRIDEWSRIEKKITHLGIIPRFATTAESAGPLDLLPAEWEVLAVVDGERSVKGVAETLGRPDFDVAKTVFGLESAGIVLLDDPALRPVEQTGDLAILIGEAENSLELGDPLAAVAAAERAVVTHPQEHLAHLVHGRALLAVSSFEEATEALWFAVELDPLSAPARRLLGMSLVAAGKFREAVEVWDQWKQMQAMPPEEEAHLLIIERIRQAALTIDVALRGARD